MLHISVTGHRSPKLGGYAPCDKHKAIRRHMRDLLETLKKKNDLILYSGGANGIDQFWMEVGQYLRLPIIAIIPFKGYEKLWPQSGQEHFRDLLGRCLEVRYTTLDEVTIKPQAAEANKERNKDLVTACDLMVAYWDGTKGGTAHAVEYSKLIKRELLIFNPNEIN